MRCVLRTVDELGGVTASGDCRTTVLDISQYVVNIPYRALPPSHIPWQHQLMRYSAWMCAHFKLPELCAQQRCRDQADLAEHPALPSRL